MSQLLVTGFPGDEHFARNLIGGSWLFPAAPFDYEIRSPLDGSVLATVPLSSRLDVSRAVEAASSASGSWADDGDQREEALARLVFALAEHAGALAQLQADETGLDLADSAAATRAVLEFAARVLEAGQSAARPRVAGHILSWGLPLAEVICSVLPRLAAGSTVVIKPSLRAPLSAVAFAQLAAGAGVPPGVINLVQGTGLDVGTALLGSPGIGTLEVRAGERTLAQAVRAAVVTGASVRCLRGGGNVLVAGPDADPAAVAAVAANAVRTHGAGGPLALPTLCAHEDVADSLIAAIESQLQDCLPAPLPTEALRERALTRIAALSAAGARLICGGAVPDDARHRMGWIVPPTLLLAGQPTTSASQAALATEPLGSVLTALTWRSPADLSGLFTHPRYADGTAFTWGFDEASERAARLPQPRLCRETAPLAALP